MLITLHVGNVTWPGGPGGIAPTLDRILRRAEDVGVHGFWPMDHFFQIPFHGARDQPMLEVYSTLAWAAGRTTRLNLGALVTGVTYRHPGALIKAVTALDVLSSGRAWLGIGAAWYGAEANGLGLPFPSVAERFERLEETLQLAHHMFSGNVSAFEGKHYHLEEPLNLPEPVRRPPILVGGGGERKTMRLVAQYADACNFFEGIHSHKLDVLRLRCEEAGRRFDEIVTTVTGGLGPTNSVAAAVERFGNLAAEGVDLVFVDLPAADDVIFDFLGEVIAEVAPLGRPVPATLRGAPGRTLS